MKPCWLIEFKDGRKIILSESFYKKEKERNFGKREAIREEYWSDYEFCKKINPRASSFGFY